MPKKDILPYSTILVIDPTERNSTSVALIFDDIETKIITKDIRAQGIPALIGSVLENNKLLPKNIDALALVKREGSMTAIRIGTAVTNTFAWLNNIPIIEVAAEDIESALDKINQGKVDKVVKASLPLT